MASKEGFWCIFYKGDSGMSGFGLIALDTGVIVGVDAAGGVWDGSYKTNDQAGELDLELTVEFAPDTFSTVTGRSAERGHAETYRFSLPNDLGREVPIPLTILGQPMTVLFKKIRDFPD